MTREDHPLRVWLLLEKEELDYQWLSEKLPSHPTAESLRQIASGYRRPSWDLAFEIEAVTEISAHNLRDQRWYARGAA